MASKKKKKLSKKQLKKKRSEAAKKGWQTRRKRAQDKIFAENNPELVGVENVSLEELIAKAKEEGRAEAIKERTAKAVADELVRQGKIENSLEAKIKTRLRLVGGPDDPDYYAEVLDIANDDEYYDYSPTEIYTMGFY